MSSAATGVGATIGATAYAPVSGGRRLLRRFLKKPMAVVGSVLVLLFLALALIGPFVTGNPATQHLEATMQPPSAAHLLGTDDLGRDVLSRLASGARVSLTAGVLRTALAMLVAIPFGMLAGFYRGWIDAVLMRINDVVLSFPFLIFAVGMAAILGPSLRNVIIALAIAGIPSIVRIVRGETMGLREQEFVDAAIGVGASDPIIMARHILPNMANVLLVSATVEIPTGIIGEASLSYLGLGVQPPTSSWGVMLTDGQQFLSQDPLLTIFPAIAIAMATLGFNLLGDGLRDVLDPRTGR